MVQRIEKLRIRHTWRALHGWRTCQRWYRTKVYRKWIEVLLIIMVMNAAALYIPAGVSAEVIDAGALVKETVAVASTEKVVAVASTGVAVVSVSSEGTGTGASVGGAGTGAVEISEAAYRIKPLQDKLSVMDIAAVEGYADRYTDMERHWSRTVVGKLTGLDIIAGFNGRFMPGDAVQADQFIKMAVMAMGHKIEQGTGYWAQPFIDTALKEGIVMKGEFTDYKLPLTREQMARIIVRTALKADKRPDAQYDKYLVGKISDYAKISDGLKQFVLDGYKIGLVQGSSGKFNPGGTLTRAEAAAVIIRILDVTERKPTVPGADEVIKLKDNLGNPMEIYPSSIAEYFEIEKVMQSAIPKAKGYVTYFYNPDGGEVCSVVYKSYEAWQQDSTINKIASFSSNNVYKDPDNSYAYTLSVWNRQLYKELFTDYIYEILKALYGKDASKAITLHDKYMNLTSSKPDGSSYYETPRINDRFTEIRGGSSGFSMYIKLYGEK